MIFMGCKSVLPTWLIVGTVLMGIICVTSGYPMVDSKEKEFVDDSDSVDKETDRDLRKRIFDPIEAASNFGSFGKRYNPYRTQLAYQNGISAMDIRNLVKRMLEDAMARRGQFKTSKRQFDPIGYGMFARFG